MQKTIVQTLCFLGALIAVTSANAGIEPLREISPVDNPSILAPGLERNLQVLDSTAGQSSYLTLKPWANGSWHLQTGLLANRYADPDYIAIKDWKSRYDFDQMYTPDVILQDPDSQSRSLRFDNLSPAEKYDLLVGDTQETLTQAQWTAGRSHLVNGAIAGWMGICEGSAAASVFYPEPKHFVDLPIPTGETVRFHVMDIKGLVALLWSSYNVNVTVAGSRCKIANPRKDADGIVIDDDCFNTNPGTFHIAVLNFLSLQKRPFFINRVMNVEVWNVPIIGYRLRYYNMQTGVYSSSLQSAEVPLSSITSDRYRRYRSTQATSLVGVEMTVRMSTGSTPQRDQPVSQPQKDVTYKYDLELNASGDIVGGEWHQDIHPDFAWQLDQNFRPTTIGDHELGLNTVWDETQAVPASWLGSIQKSSGYNQPLEVIVKKLVDLSQ